MAKRKILIVNEFSQLCTGFSTYMFYLLPRLHATGKYEITELAAYCNPADGRILDVPWKVIPNQPHPSDGQAIGIYQQDRSNQFGKWKLNEALIESQANIVCLPPSALVMTDRGYVPIPDIKVGDMVLTHKNRFRPVTKTMRRQHIGKITALTSNGMCESMKLTGEHPVYAYKYLPQTKGKLRWKDIYQNSRPEFVEAQNIESLDKLILPHISYEETENFTIKVSDYLSDFTLQNDKLIPFSVVGQPVKNTIKIDEDFGRLLGYLIGDGCIQPSGIEFFFGSHETRFVNDVKKILKKKFGLSISTFPRHDGNMTLMRVNSKILREFFHNFTNHKQNIPKEIWKSNTGVKRGIISGLIRSDGCYKKGGRVVSFCTKRKPLAFDYRMLLSCIGIPSTITKVKHEDRTYYEVNVSAIEHSKYLHNFIDKYPMSKKIKNYRKLPSIASAKTVQFLNNHIVSSVKTIKKYDYSGQVYNLEVKDDNSYVTDYCVHNCSIRDPYFDDFIPKTPLRRHFKWIHMTTCDSSPQKTEWMEMFANADVLLTYSQWGKNVLEYQSNNHLKVAGVLSPGIDLKEFVHYPTTEARDFFGIDHDAIIFGTINRNQPRKLFPDLMKCFVRYLEICKANGRDDLAAKSYLYFHTSSPDVGWDLGAEIKRHRLAHKVLFTQVCHQCGAIFPSFWQGDQTICRFCKQNKVGFPNTNNGVDRAALNRILAAWDVCIQYSIAEGWNLGINEAKASGTFVMAAEHTAMIEQCHNGGAWPLKIERKFQEPLNQTNQIRYLPDNEDCAQSMFRYAMLPQAEKDKLSSEARNCVEQLYDWDKIAKEWEALIDATPDVSEADSWTSPAKVRNLQLQLPNNLTIDQLVGWCYTHILERPDMIGSTEYQSTISSLTLGYEVGINELGQTVQMPVTVEKFINSCAAIVAEKNKIEQYRYTKICEPEKLNQRPEVVFKEV